MGKILCTSCGHIGRSAKITKGSIFIELILWLCVLIPGLIYTTWRLTSRHEACPQCKSTTIIPVDSPMGRKFIQQNLPESLSIVDKIDQKNKNSIAYRLGKRTSSLLK